MCMFSPDTSKSDDNNKLAVQNNATANKLSADTAGKANSVYSTLAPTLTQEATNPAGFAPNDLSAMHTAATNSIGGSVAGVTGQGNLAAARTRNAGAFQPALSESGREGMRKNAEAGVNIEAQNALQREKNRQSGIQGLTTLYGGLDDSTLKALGIGNQSLNVGNDALNAGTNTVNSRSFWENYALNAQKAAMAGGG